MPAAPPELPHASRLTGRGIWEWREAISAEARFRPATRLVALRLSFHADALTGECFPSQARLAAELAMHRSRVESHVGMVVAAGWLEFTRPPKRGRVNRYRLRMPSEVDRLRSQVSADEVDRLGSHELPDRAVTSGPIGQSLVVQDPSGSGLLTATADSAGAASAAPPPTSNGAIVIKMRRPTWRPSA